ncbi:DNA helicase II [Chromatiales bacterium (ex Bugula neritina AB1)]|nr:DNA helicase II [Chromatiales bacterium (ex Bugula neritina AB1)]
MDVSHIIESLNTEQREAVTAESGPLLIQAGAGSGKTRVLTHRIAWLNQVEGISPFGVLAVTFTNKAAGEMRSRVQQLLNSSIGPMWVGTFHGLSHRFLRMHWKEANLPQAFHILDSEDQKRMVQRSIRSLDLDETRWPPRTAMWYINAKKDEGLRPQHIRDAGDPTEQQLIAIYAAYQKACDLAGAVDFAELLLRALETLRDNDALLQHYQHRFQHILVDEFQDTNTIQYAWLRLLAGDRGCVFAVGDDDQSIYGWRGAKVENILNFSNDFPGTRIIRLERNYRSTGTILKAANSLIENNQDRLGKNLWTDIGDGDPITFYSAYNEGDEANFVIERIMDHINDGGSRSEAAILYRSNAQSRVLEEALFRSGLPYRVYGGMRFFERMEIKDALAYLRLISLADDDISFERVVNHPPRGIGDKTLTQIRTVANEAGVSLWHASAEILAANALKGRASKAVGSFMELIIKLQQETRDLSLDAMVEHVIEHSGLMAHYKKDRSDKGEARVENLQELVGAAASPPEAPEDMPEMTPLDAFLSHAALEAGENQGSEWEDCVQLMTLHSAKGLEFPVVFITGMEQGLFPSQRSIEESGKIDEERRLCYVGITRAERKLYLTMAEHRRLYGRDHFSPPSKFIREIPTEHLQEIRPRTKVTRPMQITPQRKATSIREENKTGVTVGQRVRHSKFGEGTVTDYEGQGAHARVYINFEDVGGKWLVMAYAKLEVLSTA